MIFLDTSGILALVMENDSFHDTALEMMKLAEAERVRILLHNYILIESAALLQNRIGLNASITFLQSATSFDVVWVDSNLHAQAVEYMSQSGTSKLSFIDIISFLVMRSSGITEFVGFDKHFTNAGFKQYG